jgi:iron complex outermembrane receptor protein
MIRFVDDPGTAPDGTLTDRGYEHREIVNAGYLTLGRQLGALGLQLGLRAEHTASRLGIPTGEEFSNDYLDLFPSANVSYRFGRSRQLRLSYSRRVQRPSASVLNPVDRSTDPLTRRVGNPDIEPQFTHSLSLDASQSGSKGNIRISAYYRQSTNDWAETITVDDDGVSTRTYQNVASQQNYGVSVTYSLRPIDGWNGFVSISGRRNVRDASNLSSRYSGSSFRWSSRARVNARVTDALSAQGNFSYSPPVDLPQGRSDSRYAADMGLRYRFLGDRASLRLSLRDPFGLRRSGVRTSDLSYIQIGRSRESTRSASISLSYTFGGGGSIRGGRRR